MEKELTIIIVTYNSKNIIDKCLASLSHEKFTLIVVDNASSDDTYKHIEHSFPKVNCIRSSKNTGFGRGCNLGIKLATTKYILLLNPDVVTSSEAVEALLNVYKNNGLNGILAPRTRKDKVNLNKVSLEEADWVSGAAMLFEKEMIDKIGSFDKNIFLFSEEVDLCKRAVNAGYSVMIANDIYMNHLVGKSSSETKNTSYAKYWHMGWSRAYFDKKHEKTVVFIKKSLGSFVKYFMKLLLNIVLQNKNKSRKYKGLLAGLLSFLLGQQAFDNNGNPRKI